MGRASNARYTSCGGTARSPSRSAALLRSTRSWRMPPEFRGKVVLVTGVGRVGQIGRAVAGARERFGGLDVVVNVAGGLVSYGPVLDLKPDRLELELAINIKTAFYVSQAAIPALRDRGGGAIVNFASAAVLKPQSQLAAYTAAKSAVAGLTRALARELRDDRIRVNAVAPGTMKTADNLAQMQGAKVRWVELDELVAAVLYLASDEAHGVSGEILAVTGGDV